MDKKRPDVKQFTEEFKKRFDTEPNRFAMIGYDTATFVLNTLARIGNPDLLKNALKEQPLYEGLIGNIFFNGTHINQEVKIFNSNEHGIQPVIEKK
jgi:ABC-type branched-subunit amino acid transport system substrate-binding protein